MKIQFETDQPKMYSLGVYYSAEPGYVKVLGATILRWHVVLYFGKGDEYDDHRV